uniref:Tc1-like transposase DDE domain-containing protein n=1 Tax=Amphimedon queenslandica TaxID=400682 RepID=A0A1X7T1K4_AMPQE
MAITNTKYVVDEMALMAGHEIVRLPVAHCTLNPFELAWVQVKGHIKANTCKFNLAEAKVMQRRVLRW